jgi:IS605 OrfB family transposase
VLTVTANIKDATLAPYLEKRAALHQKVLRKLFVAIYIKQEDPNQAYNRLAAEHGIFAVEINSIRKETEAIYSSWKELLTLRVTEQQGKIDRLDKKLNQPRKKPLNPSKAHQWKRKLHRYRTKLEALKAELTSGIPHICFGSKTLFYRQFNLDKNGYRSHADWRAHWVEGRSHTFYLAGRGKEHSGNNACMMEIMDVSNGALTCVLKLRKKNDEIKGVRAKAGDYIPFPVKFTYNSHYVLRALEEKRPITYRFIREGEHWKVQAIVALPAVPIITNSKNGSFGLDQNPLCILAAGIKPDGNEDGIYAYRLTQGHRNAKQAEHELSHIACELVDLAVATRRPIVIERLDFRQLQRELKSRGLNRLLSRFKYSLFHKLLYGRAAKFGVEIIEVNPAYSSILGWLKFGYGYGFTRHEAAAIAIGRRVIRPNGKSFSERIRVRETPGHPAARRLSKVASTKPVRKRTEHDWTGWGRLRKLLARKPSKPRSVRAKKPPAASRHEAGKQGENPYPSERAETSVEMDALPGRVQNDPSANRRGTVYAPA